MLAIFRKWCLALVIERLGQNLNAYPEISQDIEQLLVELRHRPTVQCERFARTPTGGNYDLVMDEIKLDIEHQLTMGNPHG